MKKSNIQVVIIVLVTLTFNTLCFAQNDSNSYSEKFKEIILKETVLTASGRFSFPGPEAIDQPIKGFDTSEAVPFFINVMLNGPDWQKEYSERPLLPHLARCSATLNLGAHKDKRAFEPLVEMLKNGRFTGNMDKIELNYHIERYDIRKYAAIALGMSEDSRAVEILIDSLKNDSNGIDKASAAGLVSLGDVRAIEPLMNICKDSNSTRDLRIICLDSLGKLGNINILPDILSIAEEINYTGGQPFQLLIKAHPNIKFSIEDRMLIVEDFPEPNKFNTFLELWQHWYKIGKNWTQQEFGKRYHEYTERKLSGLYLEEAINISRRRILELGVAALPLIIEKIEKGEEDFIPIVAQLSNKQVKSDATAKEVLDWWKEKKDKWTIFDYDN